MENDSRVSRAVVHIRTGLTLPVVIVGILGGAIGAVYVALLHILTIVLGPENHRELIQLIVLVAAGIVVAVIVRFGGETGDVELMVDNIHVLGGADDVKRLRPLLPASLVCIASGAAMGPEAPLVQTTGTVGTWIGTRIGRSMIDVRILTITGMAAGFTVLFGAPLGAALFALEILHRRGLQYYEALIPAIAGSLSGYAVYVGLSSLNIGPVWQFPAIGPLRVWYLALAIGLGIVGGLGAVVFATVTTAARRLFGLFPRWSRFVAGGLLLGLLAFWSPAALTAGEGQLTDLLRSPVGTSALVVLLLAKFAGTTISLAAGWKGGFIIPLFFLGAVGGQLLHVAAPNIDASVLMVCLMVALCVGVTKTPLGTTLVVTEMAGLALLPVTLVAAIVAMALTRSVSMIETQRAREGSHILRTGRNAA